MALTKQQTQQYLDDHLPYERMMLEYTLRKMRARQSQCDWNAYYESFAVHARNIYWFLTNEDKKNARACDFIPGFGRDKNNATIKTYPHLLTQVFHLGPKRPIDNANKVQLNDAEAFYTFLDEYFSEFIAELPEELRPFWNEQRSKPPANDDAIGIEARGATGPAEQPSAHYGAKPSDLRVNTTGTFISASSQPTTVSSDHTRKE